jgi:O-antigen/teichoic acid export membrane protein
MRALNLSSRLKFGFGGEVLVTFASSLSLFAIGFGSSVLVARLLGPVGRGELAAIQLWSSFFATLALVGLPEAIVFFTGQEPERSGQHFLNSAVLAFGLGFPLILLGYLLFPLLLSAQRFEVITITRWFTPALFLLFLFSVLPLSALRGLKKFHLWNLLRPLPTLGWLLVVLLLYLLETPSLNHLLGGMLLSHLFIGTFVLVLIYRSLSPPFTVDFHSWKKLLGFGLPSVLGLLPTYLVQYGRVSQLFVTAFLEPAYLGYLAVAIGWSNLVGIVPQSLGQLIFPRLASLQELSEQQNEISRAFGLTVVLTGLGILSLGILSPFLLPLIYGKNFSPAVYPALILLLSALPLGFRKVSGDVLRGLNRPQIAMWIEFLNLALTLGSLFALIPLLGFLGVPFSLLLSESITMLVLLLVLHKITKLGFLRLLLPSLHDFRTFWNIIQGQLQKSS